MISADVTAVVTTIPGREKMLARAVASVQAQTQLPGALFVQLDADRQGAAWSRNTALKWVHTPFVAWLDDDDVFLPGHLETLVTGQNTSGADLVFSYAEFVGGRDTLACCQDGRLVPEPLSVPFGSQQRDHLDSRAGLLCPWCGCHRGNFIPVTYLVRTDMIRAVDGFPEPGTFGDITSGDCEDFGALLHMLDAGAQFHHVTGIRTWEYWMHGENTGGRGGSGV